MKVDESDEIHSGRSSACEGQKKVECVVQSVSSTTNDTIRYNQQ